MRWLAHCSRINCGYTAIMRTRDAARRWARYHREETGHLSCYAYQILRLVRA